MTLRVNSQRIEITDSSLLVTGTTGVYKAKFIIADGLWSDCSVITATFKKWKKSTTLSVVLDANLECSIPAEMMVDTEGFQVGLFGSTGTINYPTVWSARLAPDEGCAVGANPPTPTPSIWNQIVELVDEAKEAAEDAAESAEEAITTANEAKALVSDMTVGASTTAEGSSATASITQVGGHYNIAFGIPKGDTGETGATGPRGETGTAATVAVGTTTTGAPGTQAAVTNSGTTSAAVFNFTIPEGQKGETGNQGTAAGFGNATATADSSVGTPSVDVTVSGPDTAKVFAFEFHNIKGRDGEGQGDMKATDYDPTNAVKTAGGIPSYVNQAGGKIDTIQLNGVTQPIVDKTVNIVASVADEIYVGSSEPSTPYKVWVDTSTPAGVSTVVESINNKTGDISKLAIADTDQLTETLALKADLVNGRVPYSQLPESAMELKGLWNASTNTPPLVQGTGTNGDFYIVSVGGTWEGISFNVNDRIIFVGSSNTWTKLTAGAVTSVAGRTGDVTLSKTDVGLGNVDNTADADKSVSYASTAGAATTAGSATNYSAGGNIESGLNAKYEKPSGGIPDSDIASASTWNGKVSCTDATVGSFGYTKNAGTITGITMNGASKGTSGVVDLGTVITSHQSLSSYATTSAVNTKLNRTDAVNAANTSYTTYMARGEALNSSDTTPGNNGCISWTYA